MALAILCYVVVGTAYYILLSFYCWPAIFIPNDGVNIIPRSVFILPANIDYDKITKSPKSLLVSSFVFETAGTMGVLHGSLCLTQRQIHSFAILQLRTCKRISLPL